MWQDHSNFYLNKNEPNRGCLLALRSIILKQDKNITETIKYAMPCFCYKDKVFCYLWTEKRTNKPYVLFVEGNYLNHHQLETGERKKMKIFRLDPDKDLPLRILEDILRQALNPYRNGAIKTIV